MLIHHGAIGLEQLAGNIAGCIVTIGIPNGVHRRNWATLGNDGRLRGICSAVLALEQHPRDFSAARACRQQKGRTKLDWARRHGMRPRNDGERARNARRQARGRAAR